MLVLGIESSCDETALAVVEDGRRVLCSLVASQIAKHLPFGGVVPEVAAREHLKVISPMLEDLKAQLGWSDLSKIDAISVTQGPGLIGALLVGVAFAKGLALALGKPLIPVNHVHAHIHGALLGVSEDHQQKYPVLALVVSGGHTNLYRMTSPLEFQLIASSIDDACGECFDKVAKVFGFAYPGGPEIEKLAIAGNPQVVNMPRMVDEKGRLEFSYSGLKTYMANLYHKEPKPIPAQRLHDICYAFQEEALGQIARKLAYAVTVYPDTKAVLIAGGVAANQRFRQILAQALPCPSLFPTLAYCSDNAAMIAALGYHTFKSPNFKEVADWDAYSRYDFDQFRLDPSSHALQR